MVYFLAMEMTRRRSVSYTHLDVYKRQKLDKVVDMIRGAENTQRRLKVEPADAPGQAKIITLTLSLIHIFKQAVRQTQGWTVPRAVGGQVKVPLLRRKKRMGIRCV